MKCIWKSRLKIDVILLSPQFVDSFVAAHISSHTHINLIHTRIILGNISDFLNTYSVYSHTYIQNFSQFNPKTALRSH